VRSTLSGSTALQPAKIDLFGVTQRSQAYREGIYQAASNRYRRKMIKFAAEMEGFIPSFGDLVVVQHDMPAWGQGGEVTDWNSGTLTLTLSEPVTFGGGTNYIALRKRDGGVDGPYAVTAGGSANQVVLGASPAITPFTGMTEERTHFAFGAGATWGQLCIVLSAKPRDLYTIDMEVVGEDSNVHTAETGMLTPSLVTSQLAGYQNNPNISSISTASVYGSHRSFTVNWVPATWAESYVVEQCADNQTWVRIGESKSTTFQLRCGTEATTYVRVAAVNIGRGAWAYTSYAQVPIATVASLTVAGKTLSFTSVSDTDLAGYRIKFQYGTNLDWGTACQMHVGLVTASPYTLVVIPSGSVTIMIRAVDTNGSESAASAYVITGLGNPLVANVVETMDYRAAGWPGTYVNASVLGGNLQATQSDQFYGPDAGIFYKQDTASFFNTNYDALTWVSAGYTPSTAAIGSNMTIASTIAADAYTMQFRRTGPLPFYGDGANYFYGDDSSQFYSGAGAWATWPGSISADNQEYQFQVTTIAGPTGGLLSAFTVSVDVPDKDLALNGVSILAGGSRLTGAIGVFNVIQNVQLTLQGGSTAVSLEITDKSASLGPLINARNSSGTSVAATIDAALQGY
jgi:hypothetical protein